MVVARKRAANDLCSHQKKIIQIDEHAAVSIAGLLSDGRILACVGVCEMSAQSARRPVQTLPAE